MKNLDHSYLKSIISYDPKTGIFIWKVKRPRTKGIGSRADILRGDRNYRQVGIDGTTYPAHRLAWFYMTGKWPKECIDHIDKNGSNNKWINLREATYQQNNFNRQKFKNNSVGIKGISKAPNGKFRVIICFGTFDTKEEAGEVYKQIVSKLHGEFYNEEK